MDSREAVELANKAKRETEAFINNYINDHAKGWPILCPYGTTNTEYGQKKDFRKSDTLKIRLTG
jgi:hypothetical protein